MTNEAKEARRSYHREWQRKNKSKVKEYQERYWHKVAQKQEADA